MPLNRPPHRSDVKLLGSNKLDNRRPAILHVIDKTAHA